MHFDWTINLGTMISLVTVVFLVVAAFNAVSARIAVFEETNNTLADSLKAHATRLDRHEDKIVQLIADLQRLIGRSETRHLR